MAWFAHGHARVYYEQSGSGEAALLLPGWGGSIDEFAAIRQALAPNFRLIAADVPGSGKSGPQPRSFTATYYQDDATLFADMLEALGATPAHLVGFSDGGEYALLMAALRPSVVRSVATWGAAGSLGTNPELVDPMESLVDDPIPPMSDFAEYMKSTYGEAGARIMSQSTARALHSIIGAGGDISRSLAANISCPALLIAGEHDFLATPALVSDMARAIPNGEFVVAAGASHPVHEEQPDWLRETLLDWFSRI